jgi:RNA polymerase sigma factor (sigma-70 family)
MFTVYAKAKQLRDHNLFRPWLFKIARNVLCRHYARRSREVLTTDLQQVTNSLVASQSGPPTTPAFEFLTWISLLDSSEREALTLRFLEEWEYHEIAEAQASPIGTIQWRVFNAKKKLERHFQHRLRKRLGPSGNCWKQVAATSNSR